MVKNMKKSEKIYAFWVKFVAKKYVIGYNCQSAVFKWVRVVKYINENASEKTVKLDFIS